MELSNFSGDEQHTINCTGDVCVGDKVAFERATFGGSFRSPKFLGFGKVVGEVVSESYGVKTGQHTFTILTAAGEKTRIKGRNLYQNGTWRQAWDDETKRQAVLDEKHARGDKVRASKQYYKDNPEMRVYL